MTETAFIFLDSNTLLHFQRPDQIDWRRLTGRKTLRLIVAPIVTRELEKLKVEHRSKRTKDRAQGIIRWLAGFARSKDPSSIRDGVTIEFMRYEPTFNFAAEHLSEHIQDDHLIASLIQFASDNKVEVSVFTADLGLQVKLEGRSIGVVAPGDELRLPHEPTDEEIELAELREERRKHQSRTPKLELYFEGRERVCHMKFDPYQALDAEPDVYIPIHTYTSMTGRDSWSEYAEAYEDWKTKAILSGSFTVIIANEGTLAATNVYIRLDFPKGILPFEYEEEPDAPNSGIFNTRVNIPTLDDPDYRQQSVTYEVKALAHNRDHIFEPARVLFRSRTEPTEFSVSYTIKCSEIIGPITGTLTFVREVRDEE